MFIIALDMDVPTFLVSLDYQDVPVMPLFVSVTLLSCPL